MTSATRRGCSSAGGIESKLMSCRISAQDERQIAKTRHGSRRRDRPAFLEPRRHLLRRRPVDRQRAHVGNDGAGARARAPRGPGRARQCDLAPSIEQGQAPSARGADDARTSGRRHPDSSGRTTGRSTWTSSLDGRHQSRALRHQLPLRQSDTASRGTSGCSAWPRITTSSCR